MVYLPCNLTLSGGKILLLFALTIAPPRYKQMAASQRNGDVFVPIPRTRLANAFPRSGPRCRFAWPGWDYTNITNPLLLTKNTLDRSMIGIMRIRAGDTLPRGKTKVSATMGSPRLPLCSAKTSKLVVSVSSHS